MRSGWPEQHRGAVRARSDAGTASDAGGRVHRTLGGFLGNQDVVGVGRAARIRGDKTAGLHHVVHRLAIDTEIFEYGERDRAPRLDPDLVTVLEQAHVELARGRAALTAVRATIDHQRAHAANAFAAIVIERDGFFALRDQLLVEDVEHLEERRVRRHIADLVGDEATQGGAILLAPDVERERERAHL
jgi:hypothetical protein